LKVGGCKKSVLRRKFIAFNVHIRKEEITKHNNLNSAQETKKKRKSKLNPK
jgi:hypothetical protein